MKGVVAFAETAWKTGRIAGMALRVLIRREIACSAPCGHRDATSILRRKSDMRRRLEARQRAFERGVRPASLAWRDLEAALTQRPARRPRA